MPLSQDRIAIIGAGTIGLSFAALHLVKNPSAIVIIYDTRPDLKQYVAKHLPAYLIGADQDRCMSRFSIGVSLQQAVQSADIVQEQVPDRQEIKVATWAAIERYAPGHALFWSSTSGIPASLQSEAMQDKTRVIVVHPFNPPHIMPLLEVVPSPITSSSVVSRTVDYWKRLDRNPVVLRQECTGFVANRLAFALLREAASIVTQGILSVEELDTIVQTSMGPRWAIAGPFKSYHAGGGEGGLQSFLNKLGNTIQTTWDASSADIESGDIKIGSSWQELICMQSEEAYGVIDTADRDEKTRKVLLAAGNL